MFKKLTVASVLMLAVSAPSFAGVSFGFGVGYTFGDGLVVGPKMFTEQREDRAAASLGIDYAIFSNSFRPNIGVAYLTKDKMFAEANMGYNLKNQNISYGGSVGYADTKSKSSKKELTNTESQPTENK